MSSRARLLAVGLLITALVGGVGGWVLSQSSGQDIQAVLYNDAVRFKVQSQDVATIRAEIFDLGGQRLFDSGPKPGNTLDWAMTTEAGERGPTGYTCHQHSSFQMLHCKT